MGDLKSDFKPFCFDREEFTKPDFNVEKFLWKLKNQGNSLEKIRDDLRVYLKILQNSMIELINEDYADFVSLSSNLVSLRDPVQKLDSSFDEFRREFASLNDKAMAQANLLREKTSRRGDIEIEENALRLELIAYSSLELAKSLLNSQETECSGGSRFMIINRLTLILSKCCSLEVMEPWSWSVPEDFRSSLSNVIEEVQRRYTPMFGTAVQHKNVALLGQLFRLFISCDRYDVLQAHFITMFLEPRFGALWTPAAADVPSAESGRSSNPVAKLSRILTLVLDLRRAYSPVFYPKPSVTAVSAVPRKFLCQCLLTTLLSFCERHFGSLFIPTGIVEFRRAFLLFADFARRWISADDDLNEKRHDTCANIVVMILKRFDMQVYSHLCFQELDQCISWSSLIRGDDGHSLASEIHSCFQRLWSSDEGEDGPRQPRAMYLEPMIGDCVRYTFGVLNRYKQTIGDFYASWQYDYMTAARNGTAVSYTDGTNGSFDDDVIEKRLTTAISTVEDFLRLKPLLMAFITSHVFPKLHDYPPCLEAFRKSFGDTLEEIESMIGSEFVRNVANCLTSQMCLELSKVSDIPRQYRWTRKDAPYSASEYLSRAFEPLLGFVDTARQRIPASSAFDSSSRASSSPFLIDQVVQTVLNQVVPTYIAAIQSVVDSVDQVSSSLNKLKRSGRSSATAVANSAEDFSIRTLSDDAKIRIQLNTDVQEFINKFRSIPGGSEVATTTKAASVLSAITAIVTSLSNETTTSNFVS